MLSQLYQINPKDATIPPELREKGLAINEDIARVFQDALNGKERRGQRDVSGKYQ